MITQLKQALFGAQLSIIHEFKKPPYGGGNQFLLALKAQLKKMGVDVGQGKVGQRTRHVLFNSFNFDMAWLRVQLRDKTRRKITCVHRVDGPISAYRDCDFHIDKKIFDINQELADYSVFQSQFSLKKHKELGLDFGQRVKVIMNAVNPEIFYPSLSPVNFATWSGPIKLIATSWSDNPRKGADVYSWLDEHLDFSQFEMTFVGNIKGRFKNIKVLPAVPSEQLAAHLRGAHIYMTASLNDPCSNALTEALSCGLPALYRNSGGHPEIVKSAGLGFDAAEEIPILLDKLISGYDHYRSQINVPHISQVAQEFLMLFKRESTDASRALS